MDLRVNVFRNGDEIPVVGNEDEWQRAGEQGIPAMCYFNNDKRKGVLYNWYAVTDPRVLAPEGWHVATDEEWFELELSFGMTKPEWYSDGAWVNENWKPTAEGRELKAATGWGNGGEGSNASGFSGIPTGYRGYTGALIEEGKAAYYWTATSRNSSAWYRRLSGDRTSLGRSFTTPGFGYAVRCIQDREVKHE